MFTAFLYADEGIISLKSSFDVKRTADQLEDKLKEKGMKVFARINHAKNARKVGKTIRPAEVVIFGNPNVGSQLIQCRQKVGIDLPQRALIWEDEYGQVWFSYNDPEYMAVRHELSECYGLVEKVDNFLRVIATDATNP